MRFTSTLKKLSTPLMSLGALLILSSCGSYQYAGYDNDGIYSSDEVVVSAEEASNSRTNSSYYEDYFGEQANDAQLAIEESDEVFTDIDSYSSDYVAVEDVEIVDGNYGGWGQVNDQVTINYYNTGWNNWGWGFNNPWLWNGGFGWGNPYWGNPYGYGWGFNNGFGFNNWGYGNWGYNNWGYNRSRYNVHGYRNGDYRSRVAYNRSRRTGNAFSTRSALARRNSNSLASSRRRGLSTTRRNSGTVVRRDGTRVRRNTSTTRPNTNGTRPRRGISSSPRTRNSNGTVRSNGSSRGSNGAVRRSSPSRSSGSVRRSSGSSRSSGSVRSSRGSSSRSSGGSRSSGSSRGGRRG